MEDYFLSNPRILSRYHPMVPASLLRAITLMAHAGSADQSGLGIKRAKPILVQKWPWVGNSTSSSEFQN